MIKQKDFVQVNPVKHQMGLQANPAAMDQSRMKSTLAVVEQIWALRQQGQSDEVIEIKINEKMKKNGFNEQQIKDVFINAQTVLKKETAESDRQKMKPFQQSQTSDMTNLLM